MEVQVLSSAPFDSRLAAILLVALSWSSRYALGPFLPRRSEASDSERPSKCEGIEESNIYNIQNMKLLSPRAMHWYVYIGQAPTGRYYTGISTDPHKRIDAHNSNKGAKFSQDQGSLRPVYISPPFPDKSSARKREIQIKGWTRVKKEKLIRGEWR